MASKRALDDDEYVAKLLAEDAKKSSLRYAQQGLSALLPRRPTGSAPKPNTRFLKALVREADSHNTTLKKKEELDARTRQRELNERNSRDTARDTYDSERPRKRRRYSDERHSREGRRFKEHASHGRLNRSSERSPSRERRRQGHARGHDGARAESRDDAGQLNSQSRSRHRSRSSSGTRNTDKRERGSSMQRAQEQGKDYGRRRHGGNPERSADGRVQRKNDRARRDHTNDRLSAMPERVKSEDGHTDDAYESDPLETLVGPLERPEKTLPTLKAPICSKGRGAYKPSGAAMDAHFSSDYNPGLDLHPESEPDDEKEDWDMALEALRDREMFKQKHAERLREVGFDDAEIKKWEDSGKEKDVADVKWTSMGEAREWDLGKEGQD
jgi:hypothetical protein